MTELSKEKMGFNATWSMAVGGMVGGGIFSVLGVVVKIAGPWAWLSFIIAGLIALISAYSYSQLANKFGENGGAFTFLREINHEGFAGSLSWVLILGYILTISVYAFTFGHYLAYALGLGAWFSPISTLLILTLLIGINLRGVASSSWVEVVTVWGKVLVLLALAFAGFYLGASENLTQNSHPHGIPSAFVGAAATFMAYEGFQLLTYDYNDIRNASKILPLASISAVISVIIIYILVTLGVTMLVGAETIIRQKEVALSVAGQQAFGLPGLILVTIAAIFSTTSAINATLFATARLMEDVAERHDLPSLLGRENRRHIPYFAVILIGGAGFILNMFGSLEVLVGAASLTFLFTFGTVNWIAFRQHISGRWFCLMGFLGTSATAGFLIWRILHEKPLVLIVLGGIILFAMVGRPLLLRRIPRLDS